MSEELRVIIEIAFNIAYLMCIWTLVAKMAMKKRSTAFSFAKESHIWMLGFALLALGDTGHVGFRVIAYAMGSLDATVPLGSLQIPLVGAGAVATAVTITFLYGLMAEAWRIRNNEKRTPVYWVIMVLLGIRLLVMLFPGNSWGSSVPPLSWSLARNLPLTLVGVLAIILFFQRGKRNPDSFQRWMAIWISVSFLCYLPVILFVQVYPGIGMLMIPKTVAYLLMAGLCYTRQDFT